MDTSRFEDYFAQVKARDARQTATKLTLDPVQPNDAAEGVQIGKELGLPPGQVMAAPQVFRERLAQERAAKALEQAPKLSDWLRNEPVASAMAKDDLDNLSWFERGLKQFADMGGALTDAAAGTQVGLGVQTGMTGAKQMAVAAATVPLTGSQATLMQRLEAYEKAAALPVDTPRHEIASALGIDPMSPTAALVADFVAGDAAKRQWHLERATQAVSSNKELMGALVGRVQDYQKEMQATQGRVPDFTDVENVKGFLDWAGFNIGQAAPYLAATLASGLVAGPAGPAVSGYAMGVGDIRAEQLTSGGDPFDTQSAGAAVAGAVPYAALEYLGPAAAPFRGVSQPVLEQVASGYFRRALRDLPQNVIEEFINEAGQEIIKDYAIQAGGGEAVTLNDDTLLKWFNAGMAGAVGGGAMSPISTAMQNRQQKDMARAERSGQTAQLLDQVSQQAQASQLRARSPEDFKRAIEASGAGDQMIYVPAVGLNEYFQTAGLPLDDDTLTSLDIDPATFAEMEMSGGRVAIPVSSFATHIAGTDMEAWVRENATIDPDELALSEAASYADLVPADMADAYEQDVQAMRDEDARKASDVQVYDGIYGMLRAAGRGVEVASREAQVMTAYFRTQAERIGEDALDLARRFNLDIRGPGQESPLPRRRGELDVLLNEIRSGVKDKPGDTLTEFVVGQGGIQDRGGDVGALEGPKGLVGESAAAIRERESMPTLPGSMPATGRGVPLDEMGRRAVEAGYFPELMGEAAGLNKGEAADLGRALLDALAEEASGRVRYREGEGPNEARAALAEELSRRGLDPVRMTNDEIASALQGRELAQVIRSADDLRQTAKDVGVDLSISEGGGYLTVSRIVAQERNQGAGSRVMQAVVDYADATGQTVALTPSSDFGGSVTRLRQFYKRFGFVENKGRNKDYGTRETMLREPKAPRELFQSAPRTDTPEFRAWFGDSKVVDAEGKPLMVYHGTSGAAIEAFDPARPGVTSVFGAAVETHRQGFYFAEKEGFARGFAEQGGRRGTGTVMPVYLSIQNPLDVTSDDNASVDRLRAVIARAQEIDPEINNPDFLLRPGDDSFWETLDTAEGGDVFVQAMRDLGYDGIKMIEPDYETADPNYEPDSSGAVTWVAFEPTQIKSVNNRGTWDGSDPRILYQDKRGSIIFPPNGPDGATTIINLFGAANLSTFFHETGHFTLEVQAALARDPKAPQQLRDDMAAIRAYLGAEEGKPFTTDQHETWARSLEAYIMEGKAPSLALADVFARVKAWLTRIYRTVAGLDVTLTPEIREVMDRMLATDAEIAEARADLSAGPLFREKPAGMSDADWATYQRMARRSSEQAEAKLLARTMEAVRRKTERWWKDERKAVRAEVEARMNALPQYRLVEAMANGRYLDDEGNATDAPDVRIDRKLLVEQFGEGVLTELGVPRLGGKRAIYGADGISPMAAAQMFGFRSAPDMIDILQNTTKRRDAIEAETDRIMLERHGDPFTDGSIEQEALDAIHNEQTQQKHVAEARQMAAQMGRDTRGMTARHYRQRAARMLERMTVREATAPARFLAAERKAGRDAERAFAAVARGNSAKLAEALQAKEQQVLNAALYDLSRQAEKEVARARERFRDYAKDSIRKKLEGGYIEQIDTLLERYDFRKRGPGQVQRSETLAAFIQRMTDEGREAELAIDPRLMDEARRVHYTRLSLEELRGLIDTVANLDHLGRMKQKLIDARRERDFAASKDRVIGQLEKVGRDAVARPRGQAAQALANYLSLAKTGDTIIAELDGLDETGVIFDELRRDIFAAESQEAARRIEMEGRFSDLIKAHYTKAQITDMAKPRNVPVASARLWAKSEILAVALNTGNESNFQRLTDDGVPQERRLTRDQVQGLLATLDENDWRFVQGVWDMMDSYSPELEAVHKRRTGTKLKRVQPMMMVGAPSFVTGGYYPLKYDKDRSAFADRDEGSAWDRITGSGHGSRIEVASGMTVTRKDSARGRPVRLDLGVPIEGMRDTIRVITLSEAVDNSARLLRDGEVKQTFFDRGLQNEWRTLELWLEDIASGPIFHGDSLNVGARVLKNNLTLMFLSFNLKTTVLQVTGLAQSAAVIGKRNMAQGIMAYLRHPQDMVRQVADASAFMRERQKTFHKDFTDRMSDPTRTDPIRGKLSQAKERMAQWGFAPIQLMQFYAVDVPTWAGAYRARLEAGDTHEAAAEYADLMVDRSQGGGFMGSRAAVSRGTLGRNARQLDFVRFFSTLGGYMLVKFSRGSLEAQRGYKALRNPDLTPTERARAAGNAAINLALLYVVEAALMAVLWGALTDEDEPEDYAKFLLKETGMAMVGGLPLVRDFVGGAVNGYGSGGMYQTVGEIPARILTQIMQGENDKAARSAFGSGVGAVTGLPTTATLRAIEGMVGDDDQTWADMFFGKNPLKD